MPTDAERHRTVLEGMLKREERDLSEGYSILDSLDPDRRVCALRYAVAALRAQEEAGEPCRECGRITHTAECSQGPLAQYGVRPAVPTGAEREVVDVVAAVRCQGGRVWVCRRTDDGGHGGLAGWWEYPGGKVEDGESLTGAMEREMMEEFGAAVFVGPVLDVIDATTPECGETVYRVHFIAVTFLTEPMLRVHDAAGWETPETLMTQRHLPSGTEFNRRLRVYTALLAAQEPTEGRTTT
jgi:8-oxo-dGTP diphosphatase